MTVDEVLLALQARKISPEEAEKLLSFSLSHSEERISHGTGCGWIPVLHPLLHANTSDLEGPRYRSTFLGDEFFLEDHVVQGRRMLPGAAHLEMARAAVKQSSGIEESENLGIEIRDVIWSRPVAVGTEPVTVQIGLYPQDGEIEYEIYIEGSEEERVVHSRGVAVVKERREAERIDIEQMRRQCGREVFSGAECYEVFQRMGVEYGPGHQGLKEVRQGMDEQRRRFVLGRVEVPECLVASAGEYELHPSVVDAAFQATIGWMVESREQLQGAAGQKAALPFGLESLEVVRATPRQGWAILREGAGSGERVQKLDIDICEEDGRLCARLRGFRARLLEREARAEAQPSLGVEESKAEERREQPAEPARGGTEPEAEALALKASQYMKKLVSGALKLPLERVEVDAPLEKYGL
ncbi:MAG: polyketide synthase dehydratase domain-containing protein, partial [Ktedonobacteraceae bacterium]|nr:polyketide synthase dehydratase domain-containing protein [Ktedonobacteraceae bacterium]